MSDEEKRVIVAYTETEANTIRISELEASSASHTEEIKDIDIALGILDKNLDDTMNRVQGLHDQEAELRKFNKIHIENHMDWDGHQNDKLNELKALFTSTQAFNLNCFEANREVLRELINDWYGDTSLETNGIEKKTELLEKLEGKNSEKEDHFKEINGKIIEFGYGVKKDSADSTDDNKTYHPNQTTSKPAEPKCEYLWEQFGNVKRCKHNENFQPSMRLDGETPGFCTVDKCPLKKEDRLPGGTGQEPRENDNKLNISYEYIEHHKFKGSFSYSVDTHIIVKREDLQFLYRLVDNELPEYIPEVRDRIIRIKEEYNIK